MDGIERAIEAAKQGRERPHPAGAVSVVA